MLGTRRETVQNLTVELRISKVDNGKKIVPTRHARIYLDDGLSGYRKQPNSSTVYIQCYR